MLLAMSRCGDRYVTLPLKLVANLAAQGVLVVLDHQEYVKPLADTP